MTPLDLHPDRPAESLRGTWLGMLAPCPAPVVRLVLRRLFRALHAEVAGLPADADVGQVRSALARAGRLLQDDAIPDGPPSAAELDEWLATGRKIAAFGQRGRLIP